MIISQPVLLLRTFALVCASSSPSQEIRRHAVVRREGAVSARHVNASLAAQPAENRSQHGELGLGHSEQEDRKKSSPSRVGTKPRRSSNLQMSDLLEVDTLDDEGEGKGEEEEEVVLDEASGLPMPKECRPSTVKQNYCEIKMWPYELQQAAGMYGNDRYQCDIGPQYAIQEGWGKPGKPEGRMEGVKEWDKGVVIFEKFDSTLGACSSMRKVRNKEVPRWGIKVDHQCVVMCKGFKFMGFQYFVPSIDKVKCIMKESKGKMVKKEEAVQEGGLFELDEDGYDGNESEKPMHAGFELNLATGCGTLSNYVYMYAALAIMALGMLCTGIASARQYYKIHRNRDSDDYD